MAKKKWLQTKVQETILSDGEALKKEKEAEFTKGLRPDGTKIGEYRNAEYAIFKSRINPIAGGYVDLMLKRDFLNRMFVVPHGKGYLLNSSDSKRDKLIGQYGIDILSINQEWFNKRQIEIYKPILIFDISKILNKK